MKFNTTRRLLEEHATVVEIRSQDGAQCIRYGAGITEISWLCGPDLIAGLVVGDTGKLYYESDKRTFGRHVFVKDL